MALCLLLAGSTVTAEVRQASFRSASLGRDVAYIVDLPDGYGQGRRFPIVYAWHGLFEGPGFWERRGLARVLAKLRQSGDVPDFVVVVPDGENSFFVNSSLGRFEDLVTRDVIEHVEATYDVLPGPASRAVLGVSMGGYAALRIAFKRPELFAAVATHSAMLLLEIPSEAAGAGRWHMRAFGSVFGNPISEADWQEADPLEWASRTTAAPSLRIDCGAQDRYGLARGNERLHEILERRGMAHEFSLPAGDHGYEYVLKVLPESLRFVGARLAQD